MQPDAAFVIHDWEAVIYFWPHALTGVNNLKDLDWMDVDASEVVFYGLEPLCK